MLSRLHELTRGKWWHIANLAVVLAISLTAHGLVDSMARTVRSVMDRLGTDIVLVSDRNRILTDVPPMHPPLTWRTYESIREQLGDTYLIAPVARGFGRVAAGVDFTQSVDSWGTTSEFFEIVSPRLSNGRPWMWFGQGAGAVSCLAGSELRQLIQSVPVGDTFSLNGQACQLAGVVTSGEIVPGYSVARSVIYPLQRIDRRGGRGDMPLTQIFLRHRSGGIAPGIEATLRNSLPMDADSAGIEVWFASDYWKARTGAIRLLELIVSMVAAVMIGLGAVSLGSSRALDVQLRRGEIGLLVALGATRGYIMRMLVVETAVIVMIGGTCGLLAGWLFITAAAPALVGLIRLDGELVRITIGTASIVWSVAAISLAALIAAAIPMRHALRIEPSIAVRSL